MASYHPLRALYLSRLREFYRQPARLFWVYGFPTVLALGLGMAFRSPAAPTYQADLIETPASAAVSKAVDRPTLTEASPTPGSPSAPTRRKRPSAGSASARR